MAEKRDTELICTVCLEPFTDPKVLPCCHTFCKKCLEGTLEKAKEKEKLVCPQCRTEHKVPSDGVKGFLNDYTVHEEHSKPASSAKPDKPVCELCDSQGTAVAYCDECAAYLCDSCTGAHKTIKIFKNHKVEAYSSDKPLVSVKKPKAIYCSQHSDKLIELYCKTCQSVACVLCVVASHNKHDFGNIDSETRKEMEGQIRNLVVKVEAKLGEFEEDLKFINEIEEGKTKEPVQLKDEINKSFDSMITTIEARRAALLEEVEAASNKALKELWAQRDVVETTIAGLKSVLSFANRSLQCSNDLELLLFSTQVKSRLKQFSEKKWDAPLTEKSFMTSQEYSIESPPNLSTLGQVKTLFPTFDSPVIIQPTSALLGKQVTLEVRAIERLKRKEIVLPQLELKVLHGRKRAEIPHPPTVTPDPEKRTWSVRFTPVISGAHVVQAKVNLGDVSKETVLTINVTGEPTIGAKVQRGPDWPYIDQDGGDGKQGVISKKGEHFDYIVCWDNGHKKSYRWACEGYYDIQIVRSF